MNVFRETEYKHQRGWLTREWKKPRSMAHPHEALFKHWDESLHSLLLSLWCYKNTSGYFTGLGVVFHCTETNDHGWAPLASSAYEPIIQGLLCLIRGFSSICPLKSGVANPENKLCCSDLQISQPGEGTRCYWVEIDSVMTAQLENKPGKAKLASAWFLLLQVLEDLAETVLSWAGIWCEAKSAEHPKNSPSANPLC